MEPYIIVPVKRLSDSKTRLAPILDAQERQMLSIHMFEDVMTAVGDTRSFSCTVLIGPDDPTSMIARVYGARFLREERQEGMTASINRATTRCIDDGADSTLIIPTEIPLVRPRDLDEIVHPCDATPQVIICLSRNGKGTNALLRIPPDIIPSCHIRNSFHRHIREADRRRVPYRVYRSERIAFDIDTTEDLTQFTRRKARRTKTHQFLKGIRLEERSASRARTD